jgi:hypothetical protein
MEIIRSTNAKCHQQIAWAIANGIGFPAILYKLAVFNFLGIFTSKFISVLPRFAFIE